MKGRKELTFSKNFGIITIERKEIGTFYFIMRGRLALMQPKALDIDVTVNWLSDGLKARPPQRIKNED